MKFRTVLNQLGLLSLVFGLVQLKLAAWSFVLWQFLRDRDEFESIIALCGSSVLCMAIGILLRPYGGRSTAQVGRREAVMLVATSWIIGSFLAAFPYWFWAMLVGPDFPEQALATYSACYFEAMSGLTTCGATVLTDIESLPDGILLWRSLTQWIGGLGIVVLFVAILPSLGLGGKKLFMAESTGPSPKGIRPHARETARVLLTIYLSLTTLAIMLLLLSGMDLFDAINHAFTSVSTAGFSTRNASIAAFESRAVDLSLVLIMILSSVSFSLYYLMLKRDLRSLLQSTELRLFLALLVCGIIVTMSVLMVSGDPIQMINGSEEPASLLNAFFASLFTVTAMATTTGYCDANYATWSVLPLAIIFTLCFIGGCSGSTAGGAKVIRLWIVLRMTGGEIEREFRPNVIRPLKISRSAVDVSVKIAAAALFFGFLIIIGLLTISLMVFESDHGIDLTTAGSAALSSVCNIGPALGEVGPIDHYGWLSGPSKILLSIGMLLGRLELFAVLALFNANLWKSD